MRFVRVDMYTGRYFGCMYTYSSENDVTGMPQFATSLLWMLPAS